MAFLSIYGQLSIFKIRVKNKTSIFFEIVFYFAEKKDAICFFLSQIGISLPKKAAQPQAIFSMLD